MSLKTWEESDEALMRRVQANEVEAFEQLYDRHAARAFWIARSVCHETGRAEDAVQEGFLSIWRGRANYRPEIGSFQGWAMATIRNRAVDSLRRDATAKRPEVAELHDADRNPASVSPEAEVLARSESSALVNALGRLPGAQAEVIALAFFGELTHGEIAARLDLPPGTVKGRMRLGLEKLRQQIDESAGTLFGRERPGDPESRAIP